MTEARRISRATVTQWHQARLCLCIYPTTARPRLSGTDLVESLQSHSKGRSRENGPRLPPFTCQSPVHRASKIMSCKHVLPGSGHCHVLTPIITAAAATTVITALHAFHWREAPDYLCYSLTSLKSDDSYNGWGVGFTGNNFSCPVFWKTTIHALQRTAPGIRYITAFTPSPWRNHSP